jgi:hypothetical protein
LPGINRSNQQMPDTHKNLDRPIWGAEKIGEEAGLVDEAGNVDLRRTFYALERGHIPAEKKGRLWVSTPRRIRRAFAGETA